VKRSGRKKMKLDVASPADARDAIVGAALGPTVIVGKVELARHRVPLAPFPPRWEYRAPSGRVFIVYARDRLDAMDRLIGEPEIESVAYADVRALPPIELERTNFDDKRSAPGS